MPLNKELVTYKDKLYWIYRKVRHEQIKEGFVNDVKQFWNCDLVVKSKTNNDDILLFLKEIEDATVVS